MRKAIGIIPAAGHGTRLRPFRYPKELFPIGYIHGEDGNSDVQLKVVCQYVLDCLVDASIDQAYMVVSDHKLEIIRFLSDGQEYEINLAYLFQKEIKGLPFAIDCAYRWVRDDVSVLVLPDTILEPRDCVRQILNFLYETQADVVLGVFPTDHAEDLCAVQFDSQGRVHRLYDKEKGHGFMNTWGMAAWSPMFTEFLHRRLQEHVERPHTPEAGELALADIFSKAMESGLKVLACPVALGKFWDIGKNSSLIKARREFESHTL